ARLAQAPAAPTGPTARNLGGVARALGPGGAREPPGASATRHSKKNFGHRLDHVRERYQRIQIMEKEYPLNLLCRVFEVSRSGYHAWRTRLPSARQRANERLLAAIRQLQQGPERCYGSPRFTPALQAPGHTRREKRGARLPH